MLDRQLSWNAVLHRCFQDRAYPRPSKSYAVMERLFREMDCRFSADLLMRDQRRESAKTTRSATVRRSDSRRYETPCSVQFTTVSPSTDAMPIVPRIATTARSDAGGGSFASQSGNAESSTSVTLAGSESAESCARGASSAPVALGVAVADGAGSLPLRCCERSAAAASAVPMRMSTIRCQTAARRSLRSRSMRTECRSVPDIHDAELGEEIERGRPAFAIAEARVFHATERDLCLPADRRDVAVQHHGLRLLGVAECRAQVARVDGGGQSVPDGVRGGESALVIVGRDDAHHRTEDLLLRDAHVRVDIGEDRRLDEVACLEVRLRRRAAITDHARTLLLPRLDALTHFAKLRVVDDRTQTHAVDETVARAPGVGFRGEQLGEIDQPRAHDDRAARRGAPLAGRAEVAASDALRSLLKSRVVHDDHHVLPAHLALHLSDA